MEKNLPVDVSHIEDLTSTSSRNSRIATDELGLDGNLTEASTHGEIGDRSSQSDSRCDVVKQTVGARLGEGETEKDQAGQGHHRTDSPIPVATVGGDLEVSTPSNPIVDVESLVARHRG